MIQFNDKNSMDSFPNEFIRSTLNQIAMNFLTLKKFQIFTDSALKSGLNNFAGEISRVTINEIDENGNLCEKKHKLIVKIAPENVARRKRFHIRQCFLREIYMYEVVLAALCRFELSKGLEEDECFNSYPKCLGTTDSELSECIVLEDLHVRGFTTIDRLKEKLSFEHVCLLMQCLAKLHAVSFALKNQHNEKFEELASTLDDIYASQRDSVSNAKYLLGLNITLNSVSDDVHLSAKIKNLLHEPIEILRSCVDPKSAGRAAVITHGDAWQNNFMFSYDANGKAKEIILLDWQLSRYSSPAIDLIHFFFFNSTKEFRDLHYDHCLKIYHETLCERIRRLGSDPEELFSYEMMLDHLQRFGKYGLITSSLILPLMTLESNIDLNEFCAQDLEGKQLIGSSSSSDRSNPELQKRRRDIVVDMARLGYI